MKKYLWAFFISMLPIIELRGAIPYAVLNDIPVTAAFLIAIIGNLLPVPFLILFSKKILIWLSGFKSIGPFFQKIIDRAQEKANNIGKYELLGVMLFVAIPLPGTGAWTGSLIAALLQLRMRDAFFAIFAGLIIAGVLVSAASCGLLGIFNSIFMG